MGSQQGKASVEGEDGEVEENDRGECVTQARTAGGAEVELLTASVKGERVHDMPGTAMEGVACKSQSSCSTVSALLR